MKDTDEIFKLENIVCTINGKSYWRFELKKPIPLKKGLCVILADGKCYSWGNIDDIFPIYTNNGRVVFAYDGPSLEKLMEAMPYDTVPEAIGYDVTDDVVLWRYDDDYERVHTAYNGAYLHCTGLFAESGKSILRNRFYNTEIVYRILSFCRCTGRFLLSCTIERRMYCFVRNVYENG